MRNQHFIKSLTTHLLLQPKQGPISVGIDGFDNTNFTRMGLMSPKNTPGSPVNSFQSPCLIADLTRVSNSVGCNLLPLGFCNGSILCSNSFLGLAVSEL